LKIENGFRLHAKDFAMVKSFCAFASLREKNFLIPDPKEFE